MVKLYNKTRCPDEILRPLIAAAGQRVGARTGKVVVKVTQRRRPWGRGMAYRGFPYLWHLTRKRQTGKNRTKAVDSDCGWIELVLPGKHRAHDVLKQAKAFFRLCLHEWEHVREYQIDYWGRTFRNDPHSVPHDARAQERRAYAAERRGLERPYSTKAEEAILALGVWLEEQK